MLSTPSTILVVGSDHSTHPTRRGNRLADSIMLIRTDPDHHSLSYLSIPRDLEVEVPGFGHEKINSALPLGGPSLRSGRSARPSASRSTTSSCST